MPDSDMTNALKKLLHWNEKIMEESRWQNLPMHQQLQEDKDRVRDEYFRFKSILTDWLTRNTWTAWQFSCLLRGIKPVKAYRGDSNSTGDIICDQLYERIVADAGDSIETIDPTIDPEKKRLKVDSCINWYKNSNLSLAHPFWKHTLKNIEQETEFPLNTLQTSQKPKEELTSTEEINLRKEAAKWLRKEILDRADIPDKRAKEILNPLKANYAHIYQIYRHYIKNLHIRSDKTMKVQLHDKGIYPKRGSQENVLANLFPEVFT